MIFKKNFNKPALKTALFSRAGKKIYSPPSHDDEVQIIEKSESEKAKSRAESRDSLKLKEMSEKLESPLKAIRKDNISLKQENNTLQAVISKRDEEIKNLRSNLSSISAEIEKQKLTHVEMSEKIKAHLNGIEEREDQIMKLKKEIDTVAIKLRSLLLSKELLDRKDDGKSVDFLLELWKEKIKLIAIDKKDSRNFRFIKDVYKDNGNNLREINPLSEEYRAGIICVCGKEKQRGSKGCRSCRASSDAIRNRLGVGMERAWIELWKERGFSMEKDTEEID